jgi:hypothetical protein
MIDGGAFMVALDHQGRLLVTTARDDHVVFAGDGNGTSVGLLSAALGGTPMLTSSMSTGSAMVVERVYS